MADLLEQGSIWLEEMCAKHTSHPVRYHRGQASVNVLATLGKTEFEVDTGEGIQVQVESRDYLIRAADLGLGGSAILPQAGDWIEDAGVRYDVAAPGREPCWRYCDGYNRVIRVHTKKG